ncbi:telomere-binding protein CDC13 NDAI_0H03820 [Naumovozyma dairenensis CBS 421]|uniref:Telomeric single stranded DNA binding POT1/Cdc13 domain-containing protein n=1 Tax=Naumovozyma dairenensis (strain ATCC 10597 / BCRC 20456 / CBS 421 / NBRC 0211 / NRRL Y-12639) TaxID=1071378 RepID=G0WFJ4_NAUDC|nr:hypothetical protein NDAI_0H03820 [Naumovozyma dairenensis CBS 421]CCD26555.1 hypothetical protein NDAI_0H03820 [Naumovozyma dairenensis CBS 421]
MSISCKFITSISELKKLPTAEKISIRFISLLTGIKFNGSNSFLLELQDFPNGVPALSPYRVKIKYNSTNDKLKSDTAAATEQTTTTENNSSSFKLARMTISLLCQFFDIDINEFDINEKKKEPFFIDEIHLEKICFIDCKCIYVSNGEKSSLYLDDVKPIDISTAIKYATQDKRQPVSTTSTADTTNDDDHVIRDKLISNIFNNLIMIDNDIKSDFNFVKLANFNNELKEFIQERKLKLMEEKKRSNPLFFFGEQGQNSTDSNSMESQIAFNSQFFTLRDSDSSTNANVASPLNNSIGKDNNNNNNNNNNMESRLELRERSYSLTSSLSSFSSEEENALERESHVKKLKINSTNYYDMETPGFYQYADLGTRSKIKGNLYGIIPLFPVPNDLKYKQKFNYRFEFVPKHWDVIHYNGVQKEETEGSLNCNCNLIPFFNSIEIFVSNEVDLFRLFHDILPYDTHEDKMAYFRKLHSFLGMNEFEITIIKTKLDISSAKNDTQENELELFTDVWNFEKIVLLEKHDRQSNVIEPKRHNDERYHINEEEVKLNKKFNFQFIKSDNDPKIFFNELRLNPGDMKYITMFGLLVSLTFENSSYVSMVFTDFTKNNIEQKYLFDSYLVDTMRRLDSNEGFRVMMYQDHFRSFNENVTSIYGMDFHGLKKSWTENYSKYGIVCKISLSCKFFKGKLNAISRVCIPILQSNYLNLSKREQFILEKIYYKGIKRIHQSDLSEYIKDYEKYFPYYQHKDENHSRQNMVSILDKKYWGKSFVYEKHNEEDTTTTTTNNNNNNSNDIFKNVYQKIPGIDELVGRKISFDKNDNIPLLNMRSTEFPKLFQVHGKLIGVEYGIGNDTRNPGKTMITYLCLLITVRDHNEELETMIENRKLLRIEMFKEETINYFLNKSAYNNYDNTVDVSLDRLQNFVGETFQFMVTKAPFQLQLRSRSINLLVWCPVEFTMEEMKSQLWARKEVSKDTKPPSLPQDFEQQFIPPQSSAPDPVSYPSNYDPVTNVKVEDIDNAVVESVSLVWR